ncbi:MAG: nucleotidyltransferase family protein [Pseudomonadales bacterium]|nr:nucleotidyltransferase family protein [Pseudomonadales bacterium]
MKALLLAAGAGRRMGQLTRAQPKPLVSLGGETLIERHLRRLKRAGVSEVVINLFYLGEMIAERLGNGQRFGLSIAYSRETQVLETGGGAKKALELLGSEPFLMISSDVVTDLDFGALLKISPIKAHLVLVPNPQHHPAGDFDLLNAELAMPGSQYTFSGIGVIHPQLLHDSLETVFPMRSVLFPAASAQSITAEVFKGYWKDIGTQDRLADVQRDLAAGVCSS